MKCECCGKGYYNMYRTLGDVVYCLDCSRRDSLCCYAKPVPVTQRFSCEPKYKRADFDTVQVQRKMWRLIREMQ